ncbi:MAG: triose-phosphate isomerase [Gemmatimonadota bacterium]|nr:MAG: triose-phosphate isomerase [Gemmatimonadota bacterium]
MSKPIFAANWKMHLGPDAAREFLRTFLESYPPAGDREVWFFPAAVALETVARALADRSDIRVGAQNVHWEPKGAFTGELAVSMARAAGAQAALVGHSERRHVFGETDEETGRKVRALLEGGLIPMLCVGEKIEEREARATLKVVQRQLAVLDGLDSGVLERIPIAYEPVWAIGTGKTATPDDAAEVHAAIRAWLGERGADAAAVRVLYGGSVKPDNVAALIAEPQIDGVLVGGASLNPVAWSEMARVALD